MSFTNQQADKFGAAIAGLASTSSLQFSIGTKNYEMMISSISPAALRATPEYVARRAALGVDYKEDALVRMDSLTDASPKIYFHNGINDTVVATTAGLAHGSPDFVAQPAQTTYGLGASYYHSLVSGTFSKAALSTSLDTVFGFTAGAVPGSFDPPTAAQLSVAFGRKLTEFPNDLAKAKAVYARLGKGVALLTVGTDGNNYGLPNKAADCLPGLALNGTARIFYWTGAPKFHFGSKWARAGNYSATFNDTVTSFANPMYTWSTIEFWMFTDTPANFPGTCATAAQQGSPTAVGVGGIDFLAFAAGWVSGGNWYRNGATYAVGTNTFYGEADLNPQPGVDFVSLCNYLGITVNVPYTTTSQEMGYSAGQSPTSRWLVGRPSGTTDAILSAAALTGSAVDKTVHMAGTAVSFLIPNSNLIDMANQYLVANPNDPDAISSRDAILTDPDGFVLASVTQIPHSMVGTDILTTKLAQMVTDGVSHGGPTFESISVGSGKTMQDWIDAVSLMEPKNLFVRQISGTASASAADIISALQTPSTMALQVSYSGTAYSAAVLSGGVFIATITDVDEIAMYINMGISATYVGTTETEVLAAAVAYAPGPAALAFASAPDDYTLDINKLFGQYPPVPDYLLDVDVYKRGLFMLLATAGTSGDNLVRVALASIEAT